MHHVAALILLASTARVALAQRDFDRLNSAVVLNCHQPDTSAKTAFQGFFDECDNTEKAPYKPEDPNARLDLVIDPRNADQVLWDTSRYKRYGTYGLPTQMDWHVPEGFSNLYTQVYYVADHAERFGHMRYFGSVDGQSWTEITSVEYAPRICTTGESCWYKMVQESKSWSTGEFFYFRALWPPPCQSELDDPTKRSCISLAENEADKDIYYAPQLGQLILGQRDTSPSRAQNLAVEALPSQVKVSWQAPASNGGLDIIGYVLHYRVDSPLEATASDYAPPYPSLSTFVGLVDSVVLSNLNPAHTYIVSVQAVNANGAGPLTFNKWTKPLAGTAPVQCPARAPAPSKTPPSNLQIDPTVQPQQQQLTPEPSTSQQVSASDRLPSIGSALVAILCVAVLPMLY